MQQVICFFTHVPIVDCLIYGKVKYLHTYAVIFNKKSRIKDVVLIESAFIHTTSFATTILVNPELPKDMSFPPIATKGRGAGELLRSAAPPVHPSVTDEHDSRILSWPVCSIN